MLLPLRKLVKLAVFVRLVSWHDAEKETADTDDAVSVSTSDGSPQCDEVHDHDDNYEFLQLGHAATRS
ncbi:hypothetical protein [Burkholderia ubonensis]|uniref:hypothetical protein n=1 Tax=Burkholderia ubonensis TaxID=101571 RepID=UPI0012FB3C50|nr:hypothetical protein [Burkholderia ubonensis]